MLLAMDDLEGYTIQANDGDIGQVCDLLFDDQSWTIRYLVVETGSWLSSRKVLISPMALGPADRQRSLLPVAISREQVRNSPAIDTERPVTRQHEIGYLDYYRYPYYWSGPALWGAQNYPRMLMDGNGGFISVPQVARGAQEDQNLRSAMVQGRREDPHLRSCKAVRKYSLRAEDGDIGHVDGMLVEEQSWALRYVVVQTGNWWLGHDVLVSPSWIRAIDWLDARIDVELSRDQVRASPGYDPTAPLDRSREGELFHHYGRRNYWTAEREASDGAAPAHRSSAARARGAASLSQASDDSAAIPAAAED
jgi:hypothetical protein